jgi:hypothetical protein
MQRWIRAIQGAGAGAGLVAAGIRLPVSRQIGSSVSFFPGNESARSRVIPRRASALPGCSGHRGRSALSVSSDGSRRSMHCSHGPVIAMWADRPHLIGCRNDATRRSKGFQIRTMASGRAPWDQDRPTSARGTATIQSPKIGKGQEFFKMNGARLAPGRVNHGAIVDPKPRIFALVASAMACSIGADRAASCFAGDMSSASRCWRRSPSPPRLRPGPADLSGDRPRPVRRPRCALVTQAFTAEFDNAVF